jgi:hypothetical protein
MSEPAYTRVPGNVDIVLLLRAPSSQLHSHSPTLVEGYELAGI